MPNKNFYCQHRLERPKTCQTMTCMPNGIFSCQTILKRAKFLEFGIEIPTWQLWSSVMSTYFWDVS